MTVHPSLSRLVVPLIFAGVGALPQLARAQVPGEVSGLVLGPSSSLAWTAVPGASFYNVYRGTLAGVASGLPPRCHGYRIATTSFPSPLAPVPGETFLYLVTAESPAGEGTSGAATSGARTLLGACRPVMRNHVFNRLGYGWDEWGRDRIAALGIDAYIAEQLDPTTVDESTNTELNTRIPLVDPPDTAADLVARQVVGGVYARRQLAEQVGNFWTNHFNTEYTKVSGYYERLFPPCTSPGVPPQCDASYPLRARQEGALAQDREFDTFQTMAFTSSFREILEASAKSPAMIVYLDTITNTASAPNENYSREILELSALGVDGGYTQDDVEQLAKVFTGWSFCKKSPANQGDPLAACISNYWDPLVTGQFVATFQTGRHDCGQKVLFLGTPQQLTIASTCGNPAAQVQEQETALDAIAAHPAAPRFISRKLLERFVTDDPDASEIDTLVAEWNDPANPHGIGDLKEVLRAAVTSSAFLNPDRAGSKVKTPLEQFVSGFRTMRGRTDGSTQVFNYLTRAQHLPYLNPVPTGWPENGEDWVDTNNTLERQNFGIKAAAGSSATFGSDPITLLVANGVSTASGNTAAIVDFFTDALFGKALTPLERQKAIDFLNTDDNGNVSNYNNTRIRDVVGFLLGYPQFQEQ